MTRRFVVRTALWCLTVVALALAARSFAPEVVAGSELVTGRLGAAGFAAYLLYSLVPFGLCGAAWWATTDEPAGRIGLFVWGRLVREAAADLLPFSQVGGIVIGAAAVSSRGVAAARVYASFVADLTTELASQLVFTAMGVALLLDSNIGPRAFQVLPVAAVVGAIVALAATMAALIVAPAALPLVRRLAGRVLPASARVVADSTACLRTIHARPRRLALAFGFNLAAWCASAAGAWIVLHLMQVDAPLGRVVALESVIFLLRSVAFAIPAGIGIQEAGYGALGTLFGLPPDAVFALALLKRLRDVGIAMPVLVAWQTQAALAGLAPRGPAKKSAAARRP